MVTEAGREMTAELKVVLPKDSLPIRRREGGKTIEPRMAEEQNAARSIRRSVDGRETDAIDGHSEKEEGPIEATPSPMTRSEVVSRLNGELHAEVISPIPVM
jgi:hypothetical protein